MRGGGERKNLLVTNRFSQDCSFFKATGVFQWILSRSYSLNMFKVVK